MKVGKSDKKKKRKKKLSLLRRSGEPISPGLFEPKENRSFSLFRNSKCPRFPDFGKEVRRSFEVHANCYDCKKFAKGCKGWEAKKKFECTKIRLYKRIEAG